MQAEKVCGDVQPRAHYEGTYGRVTGILKPASKDSTQGATFVMAFSVKPITSFNEVSRHAIEVMRAHLKLKQARHTKENVTSDAVPNDHVYFLYFILIEALDGLYFTSVTYLLRVQFAFVYDKAALGSNSCRVATIRSVVLRRFKTGS